MQTKFIEFSVIVIFHAAGTFICPLAEGQPFPKKIYFYNGCQGTSYAITVKKQNLNNK